MDVVCETCGVVGYKHLLVQCNNCKNASRHRYCLDRVIYNTSLIEWFCDDCRPKHNEDTESLDWRSDDHYSIHLSSISINEPNVNRVELTKKMWSWFGHRRQRSHKARRDSMDEGIKHFPSGDASNSSKIFDGEKLKHNEIENEGESKSDHIAAEWGHRRQRSHKARRDSMDECIKHSPSGDASNSSKIFAKEKLKHNAIEMEGESKSDHLVYQSASDPAAEIQKTMGGFEHTMNSMECLELSKSKNVELYVPQGKKADFLPAINDVERSNPPAADDSCPTSPIVGQAGGSSHTLESSEQPHPLEVVKPDGSGHSEVDPALEIEEQGMEADFSPSVNDVGQSHLFFSNDASPTSPNMEQADTSSPISQSCGQPYPLEVIEPLVCMPKSVLGSKSPPNNSQPILGSYIDVGNMDVLDLSKECMDLRSMPKVVEPSSPSNGHGDKTVEQDPSERTNCFPDMEIVTPVLDNQQGSSPSMGKECLVSDETNGSDKHLLRTTDNRERAQLRDPSNQNTSSGDINCSCNDPDERGKSWKKNGCSYLEPAVKANRHGRNLQSDVQKTSVCAGKNMVCGDVSHVEGVDSEALPSKHVSPHKAAIGSSGRKHNRPKRRRVHRTKYQESKLTTNRNADPEQLKTSSPSKQPDHPHLSVSMEFSSKTKETCDARDSELRYSNAYQSSENAMSMKRKELVLPCDEDDAEAIQVEDSNRQPAENDGQMKKHRRSVENDVMKRESAENCEEVLRARKKHRISSENGVMNRAPAENHEEVLCARKKHKICAGNGVMNRGSEKNCEEMFLAANLNNRNANNNSQAKKKQRSIEFHGDKDALLGHPNVGCARNDAARFASCALAADGHSISRMPATSPHIDQRVNICMQPIDKPYWTGIMKIDHEYISLAAHFSNQACKKVRELSRSLPPVMKVTKHSKSEAWPKRWEASEAPADSIGLYFLSHNMRPNEDLDRLVQYVTDHSIVLKYIVGFSELLIFPSALLPKQFQLFQGKRYLWGVFKPRKDMSKVGTQVKQKVSSHTMERKEQQQDKVQCDTLDQEIPVSKERQDNAQYDSLNEETPVSKHTRPSDTLDQEMLVKKGSRKGAARTGAMRCGTLDQEMPVKKGSRKGAARTGAMRCGTLDQETPVSKGQQDKGQCDSLNQEVPVSKRNMPPERQPSPDTVCGVVAETHTSNQKKPKANSEAPPTELFTVFLAQTPRSEQIIRELQSDGALVFAVKGVAKPCSIRL